MTGASDKTGIFDASLLNQKRCADCSGTGELRIESENIDENFDVQKQVVITPCQRCGGAGFVPGG